MQVHSTSKFITARTPEDLEQKMMFMQSKMSMFFKFYDISQAKDGRWYAWTDVPLSEIRKFDALKS